MDGTCTLRLLEEESVFELRHRLRVLALRWAIPLRVCARAQLVGTELATNALRHGTCATATIGVIRDTVAGLGLTIQTRNLGAGFDLAVARVDGNTADGPLDVQELVGRRGPATGLGAVERLADAFSHAHLGGWHTFAATVFARTTRRAC